MKGCLGNPYTPADQSTLRLHGTGGRLQIRDSPSARSGEDWARTACISSARCDWTIGWLVGPDPLTGAGVPTITRISTHRWVEI